MSAKRKAIIAFAFLLRLGAWLFFLLGLFCGLFMCSPATMGDGPALLKGFLFAIAAGLFLLRIARRLESATSLLEEPQ
jgi:hypothetical protein